MRNYSLRKSLIFFIIYAVIIVGIFVLQFRNESLISKNSGSLHITMAETRNKNQQPVLKNMLNTAFKGIRFSSTDKAPLFIKEEGSNDEKYLTLVSWKQTTPSTFEFDFTEGVTLNFSISNEPNASQLSIEAVLPDNVISLSLPYKPAEDYTVTERHKKYILLKSKNQTYQLSASQISADRIVFTRDESSAYYSSYTEIQALSLDSIENSISVTRTECEKTIKNYVNALITGYQKISDNPDEQSTVAYVAAMALQGKYNQAIDSVPDSFKKGTRRTYLSAPYFDSLANMEPSLEIQQHKYENMIDYAGKSKSYDAFSAPQISDYIIRNRKKTNVIALLDLPATLSDFSPSVIQAAGIINVYAQLLSGYKQLASKLSPVLNTCTQSIMDSVKLQNNKVTVSDSGVNVSTAQAADIGTALITYGTATNDDKITNYGYLIINSYFAAPESLSEQMLGELYPILVRNNNYYPHYVLLSDGEGTPVWVWTCARNITYSTDQDGTTTLDIEFPQGATHYLILSGIKEFLSIELYGMNFHTDPRFETYNSSGYVYLSNRNILLLKSKQKSQHEIIRMFYKVLPTQEMESTSAEAENSSE